jgi:hypothetical protein
MLAAATLFIFSVVRSVAIYRDLPVRHLNIRCQVFGRVLTASTPMPHCGLLNRTFAAVKAAITLSCSPISRATGQRLHIPIRCLSTGPFYRVKQCTAQKTSTRRFAATTGWNAAAGARWAASTLPRLVPYRGPDYIVLRNIPDSYAPLTSGKFWIVLKQRHATTKPNKNMPLLCPEFDSVATEQPKRLSTGEELMQSQDDINAALQNLRAKRR